MRNLFTAIVLFSFFFIKNLAFGSKTPIQDQLPEWTILVFMNADNNLNNAGLDDINEMERVGSTEDVKIVVQFDGEAKGDSVRYYIQKDSSPQVTSPVIEKLGEVDMGDWKNLRDFILWGISKYPAKKYFVDVWNHGSGWLKWSIPIQAISYDDTSGNHISIPQFGQALREVTQKLGRRIDLYGSDACLMGMLEVAYEIKDYADYIVGSEETEPFDGWPYDDFLQDLVVTPGMDARWLGEVLIDAYGRSYQGGSQGFNAVTLSLVNSAFINMFVSDMDFFINQLIELIPSEKAKILEAVDKTQKYFYTSNKDLLDFLVKVRESVTGYPDLDASIENLISIFDAVVVKSVYVDPKMAGSHGIAIWLPEESSSFDYNSQDYRELEFGKNSRWLNFLEEFHRGKINPNLYW